VTVVMEGDSEEIWRIMSAPPEPFVDVAEEFSNATARAARQHAVRWIRYDSVRAPVSLCAAVLDVNALQPGNLAKSQQTWACKASRSGMMMLRGKQGLCWRF
jgi:hypothetical protein